MFAVERLSSYISKGVYTVSGPFHIFGGAVDIIVVQHPDGSFKSAPWYVKFGKFQGVLKSKEKVVSISVNGSEAGFHMYLDHKGEAYFLKEEAEGDDDDIIFSPPSSGEEMEERYQNGRSGEEIPSVSFSSPINIPADQRCGFDGNFILEDANLDKAPQIDTANGKIMARTTSRRSRIFGLVFGRKSMKEDVKNRQGDANVQRISSLERAEIAADLLEMKWSTNLQTDNVKAAANHPRGTDGASRLSASGIPSEDAERELPVNNVEGRSSLVSSSSSSSSSPLTCAISDSVLNLSIMSRDEISVKTDDNLGTVSLEPKYSDEVSPRSDGLFQKKQFSAHCEDNMETHEQISAISDSRISELMGSLGRLPESSMPEYCDVCTLQNTCSEETAIPSLSETSLDLQSPDTAGVEVSLISHSSICTDDNGLVEDSISAEEIGRNSFIYCKASEFLTVEIDFAHEQDHKRDLSDKSCKELELHGESSSIPIEHVGDPNSCHGSCVHKGKGTLYQCPCSDIGLSIDENCHKSGNVDADCGNDRDLDRCDCSELRLSIYENSCKFDAANADCREEETSEVLISNTSNVDALAMDGGDTVAKSLHSLDICSDSIEAEAVEIFHSKRVALNDILDKNLEAEPIEFSQNIEENISFSSSTSCHLSDNEQGGEGSGAHVLTDEIFKAPNSHARMVEKILVGSNCSNTNHQGQEFENVGYEVEMPELGLSSEEAIVNPQESENVQEDQFLFSDSDIFVSNCVSRELSFSTDVDEEKYLLLTCEDVEEQCEPLCVSQPLASDSSKPGEVGIRSTPINVPQINMQSRKVKRLPESLPNIRFHIHDLDRSDVVLHTLSSSLNEDWKCGGTPKEFSSSPKMETAAVASSEVNSIAPGQPPPTGEISDEEVLVKSSPSEVEIENILANAAVEISLCKHLLFEGMGADAASQVFDSEKVSLEKFITVGPSIVKNNDRLVVKIDGCYFPWDAAAPILLGMASFGLEKILKPQGMIAVNPVKKTLDKYPSPAAAIVPSWNLWPFSFKRSKSLINSVHSPGGDFNGTNIASENICVITPDNSMHRRKPLKKRVRSLIPTSDQLASLKLREGQNVITFSFSTAMLGRQQVDARIYLWKWNTRIVISDVDGTITKSDVLGQFMPLVGKDWSQLGVAHLFSAIKENGYQLLFLSARAISQAYLTRQFLLNLKQDGKALPDGPVVISPDGLFPSLFREVIRRAPHEFKISCLEDIKALFPADCNPFYAGFGNRDTDEISYLKVGIPKGKIFIINPKGEVAVNRRVNTKSYTCLHSLVNGMFPAMCSGEQEDFNSWNYWKIPLPDIDV